MYDVVRRPNGGATHDGSRSPPIREPAERPCRKTPQRARQASLPQAGRDLCSLMAESACGLSLHFISQLLVSFVRRSLRVFTRPPGRVFFARRRIRDLLHRASRSDHAAPRHAR
ncbi:hypothetical protein BCEP4_680074 [Burkholderia cepacia]|nr:hypothetical protein BCEP4_680074 [Burkholderia cepacia]